MARRRSPAQASERLILDSGAVIALARDDQRVRGYIRVAVEQQVPIEVPVVVVAETVRGQRKDARVNWVLRTVGTVPDATEDVGRTAGRLLGETKSSATVDAMVVAQAVHAGGARILTGDVEDLERLAARHPEVSVLSIS